MRIARIFQSRVQWLIRYCGFQTIFGTSKMSRAPYHDHSRRTTWSAAGVMPPSGLQSLDRRVFRNALESPISRDALEGLLAKIEQKADSKHRSRSSNLISRS